MTDGNLRPLLKSIETYYSDKIATHGPSAKGVDWNTEESQSLRYEQLLKVCRAGESFTINDIGCGFGYLCSVLAEQKRDFEYYGSDISPKMLEEAKKLYGHLPHAHFVGSNEALPIADYSVASGIFNVRINNDPQAWTEYVWATLEQMNEKSRKGFAFNMLTKYSDEDRKRPDLFYPDPCFYFDQCKKTFSKNVALLHDYGLYEFTLIVRKAL